jgi:hypothetical protein
MCGRAKLSTDFSKIKIAFQIPPEYPTPNSYAPSWNVAPTDNLPIVRYDPKARPSRDHSPEGKAGSRTLDLMRWGLVPYWAKDIKIGYEITEAPQLVYTCHCVDCQRLTSSAFSMGIVVPDRAFRLMGLEPRQLQRTADSGRINTRLVCQECGCWIWGMPRNGVRRVRAGTLDDASWLRPTAHFWTRSKQPWITLPEGDQSFKTQPAT